MIALKENDADAILIIIREILNAKIKERESEGKMFEKLSESCKQTMPNAGKLPLVDKIIERTYADACQIHQMRKSEYEEAITKLNRIIELLTVGSENV